MLSGDARAQPASLPFRFTICCCKNGNVLDPSSNRKGRFDIAIVGDRIVRIATDLAARQARTTVDVSAYYVTPGLIDLHAYVNAQAVYRQGDPRTDWRNVNPDHNALRHGVTTVVDGGSTGWKNFAGFKGLVVDRSRVRVLAFLNIVGSGMLDGHAAADPSDLQVDQTVEAARRHPDTIVGIRSPHVKGAGREGVERSLRAAESMGGIALVEFLEKAGLSIASSGPNPGRRSDHAYVRTHDTGARIERKSVHGAHRRSAARRPVRPRTRHQRLRIPERRSRRAQGISSRRHLDRHGQDQPPAAAGRDDDDSFEVAEYGRDD